MTIQITPAFTARTIIPLSSNIQPVGEDNKPKLGADGKPVPAVRTMIAHIEVPIPLLADFGFDSFDLATDTVKDAEGNESVVVKSDSIPNVGEPLKDCPADKSTTIPAYVYADSEANQFYSALRSTYDADVRFAYVRSQKANVPFTGWNTWAEYCEWKAEVAANRGPSKRYEKELLEAFKRFCDAAKVTPKQRGNAVDLFNTPSAILSLKPEVRERFIEKYIGGFMEWAATDPATLAMCERQINKTWLEGLIDPAVEEEGEEEFI